MSDSEFGSKHSYSPSRSASFAAEANNFMEIAPDFNNDDDDVEYVEFAEEDDLDGYVVVEEEADDENIEQDLVEPAIDEENSTNDDLYHCSTCNIDFHSVTDHINEYHKDQTVLFDGADTNEEASQSQALDEEDTETDIVIKQENKTTDDGNETPLPDNVEVKSENQVEVKLEYFTIEELLDSGNIDVAEVQYIDEAANGTLTSTSHNENEEMFFDSTGRPYIRKRVKAENLDLEKYKGKLNATRGNKNVDKSGSQNLWYTWPDDGDKELVPDTKRSNNIRVYRKTQPIKVKPKRSTDEQVTCEVCNTTFASNKSYRLHARMHGPVKVRPIEEAIGYEMKSLMKDGSKPHVTFLCEICNKRYDISFQEVHRKSHKVGPSFSCTICNKKFANEVNLQMHLKAHQENPKVKPPTKAELTGTILPYECLYCHRQFARPHEKVKHERIHTGEKPYKCEICGKCFRVAYCLTLHLRTHTAARPYVCPHCNKRYKASSGYNHHLMTHSDERPYKCPHCPKAFKTSVQLAGHKNSHTKPFSCPECNRPFASLYAVKAHMETHKRSCQSLKHKCPTCGAIYARIFALKDHMKEHHQINFTEGDDPTGINISGVPFLTENETSAQSILPENVEEITIDEMDHFQTEEVVTDWLK